MAALGDIVSPQDLSTKAVRSGTVAVLITDLTKAVSFGTAMPTANYRVFLQVEGNLAVVLWATAKTTAGFTVNLSLGVAGSISWVTVDDA